MPFQGFLWFLIISHDFLRILMTSHDFLDFRYPQFSLGFLMISKYFLWFLKIYLCFNTTYMYDFLSIVISFLPSLNWTAEYLDFFYCICDFLKHIHYRFSPWFQNLSGNQLNMELRHQMELRKKRNPVKET